jgi:very-short-patch-repair endonuclease
VTFPSRLRRQNLKQPFAVRLRANATDAERILWSILRSHQIAGLRFRRQQPIGPYIVDFYCASAKLVIELDGDQHGADHVVLYDEDRTQWLTEQGYCVLRFPNADVFRNRQNIIDSIMHHLEEHDIPLPGICGANSDPPSRGG